MSESTAPAVVAPAPSQKKVRTYWELVGRDYMRNRLAMFGTLVILFVITVAVFCPLIANQRPLFIHAAFPADFDNAMFILEEQVTIIGGSEGDATEAVRSAHDLFMAKANEAMLLASGEAATALEAIRDEFVSLSPVSGRWNEEQFATLIDKLEPLYDAELSPVSRYPAIRALISNEIWLLAAYCFAIVAFAFRKRLKKPSRILMAIVVPASVVLFLVRSVYPEVNDTTNYRAVMEAPEFATNGSSAIRPLIPYGENENLILEARNAPSWAKSDKRPENAHFHLLGTDTNGRDVLARMVYGARISMLIGIVAVSIYTAIGIVLGAFAGYFGGWVDIALSRVIEIVICFPVLMLILSVQAFLAPSVKNIILAMAALWWTGVARLQRAEFLRLVNMDYVQAVRALGGSNTRIIFFHILPNALGPILVLISFGIAGSILVESALSFLGFGVPQPMASWGDLLNNGRNDPKGTWWLTIFPGFAIFITVTCFNLIGEGIRDALDPRRDH